MIQLRPHDLPPNPHAADDAPAAHAPKHLSPAARAAEATAYGGLLLYAVFAPHSIAGAWIALSISILGWLARALFMRRTNFLRTNFLRANFLRANFLRANFLRTNFRGANFRGANFLRVPPDLPLWLFYAWSVLSAFASAEPGISLPKLVSVSAFLVFYLARTLAGKRRAAASVAVAALMIASGAAGALWSAFEVARGRGVIVEEIAPESALLDPSLGVAVGDSVWRVNGRRVNSVAEIDRVIKDAPPGAPLRLSLFSRGEQVERVAAGGVPDELKARASPSGLRGTRRAHRFRASGWTRHYQTFAETLQILAQLSLGFALAYWQRRRTRPLPRLRLALATAAFVVLALGIALTAMRTVLVAFAVGAFVVAWRASRGRARLVVCAAVCVALALGAFAVWRTRAEGALRLQDESSRLRLAVARVAVARIPLHPFLGHGMDAVKEHWTEWGFPGRIKIHTHSTPIQLAFDRGLPALLLWLWLLAVFWLTLARGERRLRAAPDEAATHGLLLGATGALAGFFASSLVNYNFGDAEVALVLWWLMGTGVGMVDQKRHAAAPPRE